MKRFGVLFLVFITLFALIAWADTTSSTERPFLKLIGTFQGATFIVDSTIDPAWNTRNLQPVHGTCSYYTNKLFYSGGAVLYPGRPYVRGKTATIMWARAGQQLPDWAVFQINDATTRTFKFWIQDGLGHVLPGTTVNYTIPSSGTTFSLD